MERENQVSLNLKDQKKATARGKASRSNFNTYLREIVSIIFWSYVIIKIFIYDIDVYLIKEYFPNKAWLIEYKFVIILVLVSALWLVSKSEKVLTWALYISFYPFVVVFWKIPKAIIKTGEWNIGIAVINSCLSFFKSIKYSFFIFSFFVISTTLILNSNNAIILLCSSLTLIIILFITFINKFIYVFKPSLIYKMQLNIISKVLTATQKNSSLGEELSGMNIDKMSDTQIQKWTSSLQTMVIGNRVCYFLSSKLRNYQKSKINIIFNVVSVIFLLISSIITFTIINMGVYKAFPSFFKITSMTPNFFGFFFYSFNAIHFNSITEIKAINDCSRALFILEQLFAIILGGIFFTLFLSVKNERESAEIEDTIKIIKKQGDDMALFIEKEYSLTIDKAIGELERLKGSLIQFIFYMSNNM